MNEETNLKDDAVLEEIIKEEDPEGIAMELLHEFKEHNKRMDEHNKRLISAIKTMSISFAAAVAIIIISVFVYLYQYDFQSYSQDGSGYNNINTGTQGDVNNGAAIPSTQEEGW